MKVFIVDKDSRRAFVEYARRHGAEHDDSFTTDEDLEVFDPDVERAILIRDDSGLVVGAASLMVQGYSDEGMARFRILHALHADSYARLLEAVLEGLPATVGLVYLFLPEPSPTDGVLASLGFAETRRASLLRRPDREVAPPAAPPGVEIRVADPVRDAAAWAGVVNAAFAGDPGCYDVTASAAREWIQDSRVVAGGALLATRWNRVVGVSLAHEAAREGDTPGCSIETVAVIPGEQGAGIGRALLRSVLAVCRAAGLSVAELSTGETNRRAVSLYGSEGFDVVDVRVCWGRAPSRASSV